MIKIKKVTIVYVCYGNNVAHRIRREGTNELKLFEMFFYKNGEHIYTSKKVPNTEKMNMLYNMFGSNENYTEYQENKIINEYYSYL